MEGPHYYTRDAMTEIKRATIRIAKSHYNGETLDYWEHEDHAEFEGWQLCREKMREIFQLDESKEYDVIVYEGSGPGRVRVEKLGDLVSEDDPYVKVSVGDSEEETPAYIEFYEWLPDTPCYIDVEEA